MHRIKASDLHTLRQIFRQKGGDWEQRLLAALDPTTQEVYRSLGANSWIDHAFEAKIIAAAAPLLHPGEERPFIALGRDVAKIHFTGIYRSIIGLAKPEFLIKRTNLVWRMYNDQGELRYQNVKDRHAEFILANAPELTLDEVRFDAGFIWGVLDLIGRKHIRLQEDYLDPNARRWVFDWD